MSTPRRWLSAALRPALVGAAMVAVLTPATAAHADPSPSQIESQITAESTKLEATVEQYNQVSEELTASQAAADALAAQIRPLAAELDTTSKRLNQVAVLAYQGGGLAQLTAVVSAGGHPSVLVDRLATLEQFTRIEHDRLADYTSAKARFDVEAAKSAQLIADQTAKKQTLEAQRQQINANLNHLSDLRRAAYGAQQAAAATYTGPPPAVAGRAGVAVNFAYGAIGTPYVWAGASPSGYDCSGLTMAAWRAAGVSLPHNAAMQWNALPHISRAALAPGDLVFYSGLNHVAIYVGNGQIIHAPTFGDYVRLASVDMMPPYGYARPG